MDESIRRRVGGLQECRRVASSGVRQDCDCHRTRGRGDCEERLAVDCLESGLFGVGDSQAVIQVIGFQSDIVIREAPVRGLGHEKHGEGQGRFEGRAFRYKPETDGRVDDRMRGGGRFFVPRLFFFNRNFERYVACPVRSATAGDVAGFGEFERGRAVDLGSELGKFLPLPCVLRGDDPQLSLDRLSEAVFCRHGSLDRFIYKSPILGKIHLYFVLGQHVLFDADLRVGFLFPVRRADIPIAKVRLIRKWHRQVRHPKLVRLHNLSVDLVALRVPHLDRNVPGQRFELDVQQQHTYVHILPGLVERLVGLDKENIARFHGNRSALRESRAAGEQIVGTRRDTRHRKGNGAGSLDITRS